MEVDDDLSMSPPCQPSHPLDLLHLQVIDYFTQLLLDLVVIVGVSEVHRFGNSDTSSQHAPPYTRKHISLWTASDCIEYLNSKQSSPIPNPNPKVEIFLTKPYHRGARRGQDWTRRDWEVALETLGKVGDLWGVGSMVRGSVEAVKFHVTRIFAMPLRPTGVGCGWRCT